MSYTLIDYDTFDFSSILLKPPFKAGNFYISEIWCLNDKRALRPIFKTPRLKIKYGAKRYLENTTCGYTLDFSNKVIDVETANFYQFIRNFDKGLINVFTEIHKTWPENPAKCLKYKSALKRKTPKDDFYFQLKLIDSSTSSADNRNIISTIHNSDRSVATIDDIVFNKYADQFICPAYLYYDDQGIHPIWQAHQVVISTVEKVFLEQCLLDHICPIAIKQERPFISDTEEVKKFNFKLSGPEPQINSLRESETSRDLVKNAPVRFKINPLELTSVLNKLKKTPVDEDSS
jgi:hypothetical protein